MLNPNDWTRSEGRPPSGSGNEARLPGEVDLKLAVAAVLRTLRELERVLKNLLRQKAAEDVLLDKLLLEIGERIEALGRMQEELNGRASRSSRRPPPVPTAEPWALKLKLVPRADGGSCLQIDGGRQVSLPPRLTQLVQLLRGDSGRSDDDLLGWRSLDAVATIMARRTQTTVRTATVRNWVWRLREALEAADYDRRLVQTNKALGVRLAVKRRAGT